MSHHGQFVWYELVTSDVAGAAAFYGQVIGWDARDSGHPDMSYTLLHAGETAVAGLMELTADMRAGGARPGWLGYVAVDDVDARATRVTSLGGMIHRAPTDIPGVGRFCVIADPQGAVIVLFKGTGEAPPAVAPGTPGHAGWRELMAAEWMGAFAFYHELFGWAKAEAIEMGPMGTYQIFAAGTNGAATAHDAAGGATQANGATQGMGGMMTKPAQMPPHWRYYVNVDGIDAAVGRVVAAGGAIFHEPMQVPGGSWVVQGTDPQGAVFALVSATR